VSDRAAAYGIPGETVDGNDVEQVYEAMLVAAARAREGSGPTLVELETFRFAGHSRSDPGHYRSSDEVTAWKQRDPIGRYEARLKEQGLLTEENVAESRLSVEEELDEAVRFAEQSPDPMPEECLSDVFAE
jgi:TPP-dependent pyruvate/acetoin dehydrogenase alpha subunit